MPFRHVCIYNCTELLFFQIGCQNLGELAVWAYPCVYKWDMLLLVILLRKYAWHCLIYKGYFDYCSGTLSLLVRYQADPQHCKVPRVEESHKISIQPQNSRFISKSKFQGQHTKCAILSCDTGLNTSVMWYLITFPFHYCHTPKYFFVVCHSPLKLKSEKKSKHSKELVLEENRAGVT